jgi:hypothetical protein
MEGYKASNNGNGTETLDINVSSVSPNKEKLSLSVSESHRWMLKTIYKSLGGPSGHARKIGFGGP